MNWSIALSALRTTAAPRFARAGCGFAQGEHRNQIAGRSGPPL
jgi:hypothetical protein